MSLLPHRDTNMHSSFINLPPEGPVVETFYVADLTWRLNLTVENFALEPGYFEKSCDVDNLHRNDNKNRITILDNGLKSNICNRHFKCF